MPNFSVNGTRKRIAQGTWQPPVRPGYPPAPVPPDDAGKLLAVYQTALIIGAALLEGATFFLAIAYFLEGQILSLIVAGVLMGLLVARFPTRSRVAGWIDRELERIDQERQGGS